MRGRLVGLVPLMLVLFGQMMRGVDQRDMGQRLRKIADRP